MAEPAEVINIDRGKRQMPSKNGYISLWRDIKKQPFYKDFIARGMLIDMLLEAQHRSVKIEVDGESVFLNSGQLFTKRKHFVDQGIDDSKVKRTLEKFENLGIITRETIAKGKRSIGQRITFLNWQKWQKIDQSTDQSSDQPHTAEIKGLNRYTDQCSDQSTDQENNNVYNNKRLVSKDTCQNSSEFQPVNKPKVPYQQITNLFGEILTDLPQPRKLTSKRKSNINARHKDLKQDLTKWRRYFEYVRDNCQWMLTGDYSINFDYLVNESNFANIVEGAKDDRK